MVHSDLDGKVPGFIPRNCWSESIRLFHNEFVDQSPKIC